MCDNVRNWKNLPDEIKPNFVSCETDYDFPYYLSKNKEWVNNEEEKDKYKLNRTCNEPFLIMELNRFVPYIDRRIKFHPLNMPDIEIKMIEIAGFVLDIQETKESYKYTVDDGTGMIIIYYKKCVKSAIDEKRKQIDDKYIHHLYSGKIDVDALKIQICPNKYPEPRPNFKYTSNMNEEDTVLLEHNWSLETKNGTFGKPIQCCSYISAKGKCGFNFFNCKWRTEITFYDLPSSQLIFWADEVSGLTEKQYSEKVLSWIETNVQERYNKGPVEKFMDVHVPIFDIII